MKKLLAVASIVALSSCATIVSDSDYAVNIQSTPDSAEFEVFNKDGLKVSSGTTPNTVMLDASAGYFQKETYKIRLTKTGYKTQEYILKSGFDGWYIGNILLGGWIGMLFVDPLTGAMWTLPNTVSYNMNKAEQLSIVDVNTLSEKERAKLVKVTR